MYNWVTYKNSSSDRGVKKTKLLGMQHMLIGKQKEKQESVFNSKENKTWVCAVLEM